MSEQPDTVDFGYQKVSPKEKTSKVAQVFHSVASRYDVMNDLMSLGIHRLWKRLTIELAGVRQKQHVLDLASGTGDLALKLAHLVGPQGQVVLSDINDSMLAIGRGRLEDAGVVRNVSFVQADAEWLPFADNYFDCVTMAFGLRNVTHKDRALASIYRVLKPGGKLMVLEFSKPTVKVMQPLYDAYCFTVLPLLGKIIAKDAESYRYLAESIRMHPDQETLLNMFGEAGFNRCHYQNLSQGIVALHTGYKY